MFERLFKKHLSSMRIRHILMTLAGLNIIASFILLFSTTVLMTLLSDAQTVPIFAAAFGAFISTLPKVITGIALSLILILIADYISPIWPHAEEGEGESHE